MRKLLAFMVLSLAFGCGVKMGGPLQPITGAESDSGFSGDAAANDPLSKAPVTCKDGEVINNGVCMAPPPKCTASEVYLAYLDKCVANTPENVCFSKGQVLSDGACATNAYYSVCILKTGRMPAQDNMLAKLKTVAADTACEGSYLKLAQLTSLDVSDVKMEVDLRVIADFTKLTELNAEKNLLTSAAGVEKLKNLRKLNLSDNQIVNLTPLTGLTMLEDLDLEDNKIKDLKPIGALRRLTDLDLSKNDITDIDPVNNLTALKKLKLKDNGDLDDLFALFDLFSLESLDIEDTDVEDLSPLMDLFLLELKISGSKIADFTIDQVSEDNCPVDNATSAVLYNACALLRGLPTL